MNTNKIDLIKAEVVEIVNSINPFLPDEDGNNSEYEAGRFAMATQILQIIDSLQEEPVSKNMETDIAIRLGSACHKQVWNENQFSKEDCKAYCSLYKECQECSIDLCMIFFHDPHCHFEKEPVSEDFEAEWKEYFKYRGDIATVNIKDLAKHFANWQKERMLLNNDEYQTVPVATLDRLYASEKKLDQMMKDAMEAKVIPADLDETQFCLSDYDEVSYITAMVKAGKLKLLDKVKVVIVKEN